jgi:hypothetical protein
MDQRVLAPEGLDSESGRLERFVRTDRVDTIAESGELGRHACRRPEV